MVSLLNQTVRVNRFVKERRATKTYKNIEVTDIWLSHTCRDARYNDMWYGKAVIESKTFDVFQSGGWGEREKSAPSNTYWRNTHTITRPAPVVYLDLTAVDIASRLREIGIVPHAWIIIEVSRYLASVANACAGAALQDLTGDTVNQLTEGET